MWALVIGVSNYVHARPLKFAARDAQEFSEFLKSPRGGGIPENHVFVLLEDQVTELAVRRELHKMAKRVQPGDSVYVYIAGHGTLVDRLGYFITSDVSLSDPDGGGVYFGEIKELIEAGLAHANVRVLITDLCNAGRIGIDPALSVEDLANALNDEVLKLNPRTGTFLNFMASGPTEASWEQPSLRHGVFTYSLLEALNGKANPGLRMLTAGSVVDYVKANVARLTGSAQHPVANNDFDPGLLLSFPDLPGPIAKADTSATVLVLEKTNRSSYSRVEWFDPRTQTKVVRQLPRDRDSTQIGFLSGGRFELRFFDDENGSRAVTDTLQPGRNALDVSPASDWKLKTTDGIPIVSLFPFVPAPAPQAAAGLTEEDSSLIVRLSQGTNVFLDEAYFGSSEGNAKFQLAGLTPGVHRLRLVPSAQREYRFRVTLFPGLHVLDISTGELRFILNAPLAPSQISIPPGVPAMAQEIYRNFERSFWEDRLIQPRGDSAWDYYMAMRPIILPDLRETLEDRLIAAMGSQAQRTLLRYIRGGDIKWNAGIFEESSALLERAQQLFTRLPAIESRKLFFDGRALSESGRYDDAINLLERVTRADPQASHAFNAIGLSLWKQNFLNRAIPPLERATTLTPQWNYPRNTLALIYVEQRRYPEAEATFLSSIRNDPEDSSAYHGLAQLYMLLGRQDQAEAELQRAIEFNPGNAYAYETYGKLRQIQGRLQEAEDDFRLAMKLEPDEPSFKASLGELLLRPDVGRTADAGTIFAELAAQSSDNLAVASALGRFYTGQKRYREAATFLKRAINKWPGDSNLRVLYGGILLKRSLFENAERQFRAVVQRNPDNAFAFYNLAISYLSQKKFRDADRAVAQAIRADPRFANSYQLRGQIRYAERNYEEAQQEYRRAFDLSIEPSQRQELCDSMVQTRREILQARIDDARRRATHSDYSEAWSIYPRAFREAADDAGTLANLCSQYLNPDDLRNAILAEIRNAVLEFDGRYPGKASPSDIPDGVLKEVLDSAFWKDTRRAEDVWLHDAGQATTIFLKALQDVDGRERQNLGALSFNLRNPNQSIHQVLYGWGRRFIDRGDYTDAIQLMELSIRNRFFCVVSEFPIIIDSLMIPPNAVSTESCPDFQTAFHADRRAHEIYAAAHAGLGDLDKAMTYLRALESTTPDVGSRVLIAQTLKRRGQWKEVISILSGVPQQVEQKNLSSELYELLGEAQCRTGDCATGRATLNMGLRLFPKNKPIREVLKRVKSYS